MGHCDNFKTPTQLGLVICTADVTCYNGANLECVELPSNPSLNDVIEAIDNAICSLTEALNNIDVPDPVVVHPDEPWVYLTNDDLTFISYSGESGNILNGLTSDIDVNIKYNVIAPNALAFKATITIPFTIDSSAIGYSNGGFIFTMNFPSISSVVNGWFNGTTKEFVASPNNPLIGITITPPSGGSNQYTTGGGVAEFLDSFGDNQVRVLGSPNGFNEDGDFEMTITIDTVVEIS